jgi:hypothetical protein
MAYFSLEDGVSEGTWQDEWLNKEVMPRLVKINIKLENQNYCPEMIFDLKVTGTNDNIEDVDIVDNIDPGNPGNPFNSENTSAPEAVQ